jgi:hypothetical protein
MELMSAVLALARHRVLVGVGIILAARSSSAG